MSTDQIIDADGHIVESTLLPSFRAVLHEERVKQGRPPVNRATHTLGGTIGKYEVELEARLADMDSEGISVSILFPTAGLNIGFVRDPEHAISLCREYNDAMFKLCESVKGRLKAIALLAPQNVNGSVDELKRGVNELGALGGLFPTTGHNKMFGSEEFYPVYECAEELNRPLTIHANAVGGDTLGSDRFDTLIGMHTVGHPFDQMLQFTSMILGGIFDRFTRLRVGYMEAGCGWVPYLMDRLDEEIEVLGVQAPAVKCAPSIHIRSGRIFVSCESDDKNVPYFISRVSENAIMYASDYPHFDMETNTVATLNGRRDLTADIKRKLLHDNATIFYNLS
jgi:predicted TIM-barrel fold metal-dependent hydrolase